MTCTPFGSLIGSGIATLASPVALGVPAMGGLVFGLFVLTAVVILVAGHRRVS
jgi:hypothetical protein